MSWEEEEEEEEEEEKEEEEEEEDFVGSRYMLSVGSWRLKERGKLCVRRCFNQISGALIGW